MFVALRENGTYISLAESWKLTDLQALRREESFTCPACQSGVQLKLGNKVTFHFAHYKGAYCTVKTEPESEYHLQGKKQLFNWLHAQGYHVILEPYLPHISQRPDILVTIQNQKYAIEFQCSQIEYSLFKKRTNAFMEVGIIPIWILGAKLFKRKTAYSIHLSSFQWLFATSYSKNSHLSILYYCPSTSQFLKASNIVTFSGTEAICDLFRLKENMVTFPAVLKDITPKYKLGKIWLEKKKSWRLRYSIYPSKNLSSFLTSLYVNRIPPSYLPGEIGVPVPSMFWFQTPSMIWQMWILLDVIIPTKVGDTFFFSKVMQNISQRIVKHDILIRQLPLISHSQYSAAVMEYLLLLEQFHIVKQVNKTTFQKLEDIRIPTTIEQAYEKDECILKKFGNCC
ncbi:competence protein CoiA [Fredinandcohnia humi]